MFRALGSTEFQVLFLAGSAVLWFEAGALQFRFKVSGS